MTFKIIRGSLKVYEYRSDESDRKIKTEFCPNCGTTITFTAEFFPGARAITGGTLDDPNWLTIKGHFWTRSAHKWMVYPEGVHKDPTQTPPRSV